MQRVLNSRVIAFGVLSRLLVAPLLVLCAGCASNKQIRAASFLYPCYTASTVASDGRILGVWVSDDGSSSTRLKVGQIEDGKYAFEMSEDELQFALHGVLFKVGEEYFIDLTAPERSPQNPSEFLTFIPAHLLAKIAVKENELRFHMMNYYKLYDLLLSKPKLLTYYEENDGFRAVVTSSSQRIQMVLTMPHAVSVLFDAQEEIILHRLKTEK